MKISFEIYTSKVLECKEFYTKHFDFIVKFEADGFVVLNHKKHSYYELMFCILNSEFVHPIFHPEFNGKGAIIQMEVERVEMEYERIKNLGLSVKVPLINEEVNGYHFTIQDPGGLLIDIVEQN